ncbi:MAG: hypothetical protein KBG15_10985, partial [Kofleriaceae bacterium]|nr:hypothetical protein [Kofleriaceae bacterium]
MKMKACLAAVALLGAVAFLPSTSLVRAQPAEAIGRPLPGGELPVGTVTVRIVAGAPSNIVAGTDVTLTVNGAAQLARTDASGRATFATLPPGATVQASIVDAQGKAITSQQFQVPNSGGTKIMLSTVPWGSAGSSGSSDAAAAATTAAAPDASATSAPMAGGQGMPQPRELSGRPRPEQADPGGQVTVRLAYDSLTDATKPAGILVHLVGYSADDSVVVLREVSDAEGRAVFKGLDKTGATSYFAMALLARGGFFDRTMSAPMQVDGMAGIRLILSGEKRDSTAPAADDLNNLEKQDSAVAAGKVLVAFAGAPDAIGEVKLIDASTGQAVATTTGAMPTGTQDTDGTSSFVAQPGLLKNTLDMRVVGLQGRQGPAGLANIRVTIEADPSQPQRATFQPIEAETAADGSVRVSNVPSGKLIASATVNGKKISSTAFDVTTSGGTINFRFTWGAADPNPMAQIDAAAVPVGSIVYAETKMRNERYRSLPFQIVNDRGTSVTLFIYPRTLFSFSLHGEVEDRMLGVQGRFEITNYSWAPYRSTVDGLVIPLPHGHTGAILADQDKTEVSVDKGTGFRILRPIPPGGRKFHGGFSVPVESGTMRWDWALPFGSFQSGIEIAAPTDIDVSVPAGATGSFQKTAQGRFYVLPQISIMPKQAMIMTIHGFPAVPAWKIWAPRLVGIMVLAVLVLGIGFALLSRAKSAAAGNPAAAARAAKRQALLDELVELDRTGSDPARRAALVAALEQVW